MSKYFLDKPFETLWPEKEYPYRMDTHPTVRCAKALSAYNKGDNDEFEKHVDWLLTGPADGGCRNVNTGAWEAKFLWDKRSAGYYAKPPWMSSMTQGMALSVMVRANELFGIGTAGAYRRAIVEGLKPFDSPVEEGGLLRYDQQGDIWYEGIPSPEGYQILNEFMFSLIGLYEVGARGLFNDGMQTLEKHLPNFDLNYLFFRWSKYDNGHHCYSQVKYHRVHIKQLRWLAQKTGSRICAEYAKKWDKWEKTYINSRGKYIFLRIWKLHRERLLRHSVAAR